jgi:hypothetical protein
MDSSDTWSVLLRTVVRGARLMMWMMAREKTPARGDDVRKCGAKRSFDQISIHP